MNIRLHTVISQIHGSSGIKIIQAILSGEREHLFTLQQAYDAYCFSKGQIEQCDVQIEKALNSITNGKQEPNAINKAKPIRAP